MENNQSSYITTDEGRIINEKYIRWIAVKMNECLAVCVKANGCEFNNTHKICKKNNPSSYNKLNKLFE